VSRFNVLYLCLFRGLELTQCSSSKVPQVRIDLRSISYLTSQTKSSVQNVESTSRQQLALIETLFLPKLETIESLLQRLHSAHSSTIQDRSIFDKSNETNKFMISRQGNEQTFELSQSTSKICVQTYVHNPRKCEVMCKCQCHKVSKLQYPLWITGIIGSLFIGYSGIPLLNYRKCNEKSCKKEEGSMLKIAYYFPTWCLLRKLSFMDRWNSLDGHQVSLHFPRVVPDSSEIFILAQKGNVKGLQELFSQHIASIYDVSAGEGRSALHVSNIRMKCGDSQPLISRSLLSLQEKPTCAPSCCLSALALMLRIRIRCKYDAGESFL
jgi:hypothetical protein